MGIETRISAYQTLTYTKLSSETKFIPLPSTARDEPKKYSKTNAVLKIAITMCIPS